MRQTITSKWFIRCCVVSVLLLLGLFLLHVLAEPGLADPKTAGVFGLWINFLGTLHPVFLHLPIGAFIVVMLLEGIGLLSRGRYKPETMIPLMFTLVTSFFALLFGYCLYLNGSYSGELIEEHKTQTSVFCGLVIASLLLKIAQGRFPEKLAALRVGYLVSLFVCGGVMGVAGHHGGEITHGDPLEKLPAKVMAKRAEAAEAMRGDPIVYQHIIQPVLEESCVYCHGPEKQEGSFRMDTFVALLTPGDSETGLVPGDPEESGIISRLHLPHNDEHHMPPSDKPQPTDEEVELLTWWVSQGAPQTKKLSELEKTPGIEDALATMVAPGERKARDQERKRQEQEERKRTFTAKEKLRPELDAFNRLYPEALNYIASDKADLRFTGISFVKSFGHEDLEKLLPFAGLLRAANFSLTGMDDESASTLSRFTSLRELNLSQTGVGDALVASITNLTGLTLLNLYGTKVTPASTEHLRKLPALQTLYLGGSGLDAVQTAALRVALSEDREIPVEVIGVDEMPDLRILSEEGAFAHKVRKDPKTYGDPIGQQATVTLSSSDARYSPEGGLATFTAREDEGVEFAFHSKHEKNPWVQLSFEKPHRITGFLLRNRETLPERADGLELQRLRPNGSWERIWTSPSPAKTWPADLLNVAAEKREATAFRFILNTDAESMLHLAHLSLWGQALAGGPPDPVELSDTLNTTGQGEWTYVVEPHWGHLPGQEQIGPTHGGIVVDRAGRVYVSTDGPKGILVYRRDGTYLTSLAKGQGRYHGLCIHSDRGQEFIYAAANTHIAKYTLSGELVLKIEGAKQAEGQTWAKATAVAVAPNGDIFVADGYGTSVIFKYNPQGRFLKKFGARGHAKGQFITSHGLAVDSRNPDQPLLIVCDRENRRLQHFDLEGNFVKIAIEGLRRPCSVAIWKDLLLVAELAGRAVLVDRDYKIVSTLGDNPTVEEQANFHVHPDAWKEGVFTAPHGCSFDDQGNIYIQDWNKWGRVTRLLLKKRLYAEDVSRLAARKEQGDALHTVERSDTGWKPSQLNGLGLWLDADDLSTITASSGSVSQWDDKSANRFHAYALSAKERPRIGDVQVNGKNALEFSESRLASKVPEHGDWRDIFVVADWNGGPKFDNFNGLLTGFAGSLGIIGDSRGGGTGLYLPETWWNTLNINGHSKDVSNVMSILSKPFMASITADKATDVTGFCIGNDRQFVGPTNVRDWEGSVCEIIGFNRNLSDAERQQVEGYLAHKWGLIATIPADHPYKTKVP